jgi:BASS family bile acid:Na+ symporter
MSARTTLLFPLLAIACSLTAYLFPAIFIDLKPSIVYLLGMVMFGMGMTLTPAEFTEVLKRPGLIVTGLLLQYLLMPAIAWGVSTALGLSTGLVIGMVLVGASPGGTASNVICYLARGNVALSIALTTVSTLVAVAATPVLTYWYVGHSVDVPVFKMLLDVLKIIIAPVVAGVIINYLIGHKIRAIKQWFSLVSVFSIVLIISIIVALNQSRLSGIAGTLVTAVIAHNGIGLAGGYWISRALGFDRGICRTLAIEVGMQNSGLAVTLAIKYFSSLAALPGALFSIWHNISGALLAAGWASQSQHSSRS